MPWTRNVGSRLLLAALIPMSFTACTGDTVAVAPERGEFCELYEYVPLTGVPFTAEAMSTIRPTIQNNELYCERCGACPAPTS